MGDRRHCACIFESTSGPPIQWCSHHATLRKESERLTAENAVLWQTLEHIAAMTDGYYRLGNATALAQFAVESRDEKGQKHE